MGGQESKALGGTFAERLTTASKTGRLRVASPAEAAKLCADEALWAPLSNLRALDLSACKLTKFPVGAALHLRKLETLRLCDNPGLKELPDEILKLDSLRSLEASRSGLSVLAFLPSRLERLDVSECAFHGVVDHSVLSLPSTLVTCNLSGNQGIQALGAGFGFEILQRLSDLDLSGTSIAELPESIGELTALTTLKLERTKIRALPQSLFVNTPLARLELAGCPMTKADFLKLEGVEVFMTRREARINREVAGGGMVVDTSVCGLD